MSNLPIGTVIILPGDGNTYTKVSNAETVADGTPGQVEIWNDQLGNEWTPNLEGTGFNPIA